MKSERPCVALLTPDLHIELKLESYDPNVKLTLPAGEDWTSDNVVVGVILNNHTNEPALYSVVNVMIDGRLNIPESGGLGGHADLAHQGLHVNVFTINRVAPAHLPSFKEHPVRLG